MQVQFLRRSYFNGSIVEPGEVISVPDSTVLGQHMVRIEGDNDHIVDPQPSAGAFRADLAYFPDPEEARAKLTEEARLRAEATRAKEAEEEARRIKASTAPQPTIMAPARPVVPAVHPAPVVHPAAPPAVHPAPPKPPAPPGAGLGGASPDAGGATADG